MLDYYARRAPEYEAIYERPERRHDLATLKREVARRLAGRRVLDIACGTGYWTAPIASAAREVIGIDANPAVLDVARAKRWPATVRFETGDAYRLPGPTRYDGAFIGFFWSHVPKARLPAFVDGVHAVLSEGARVLVVDNLFVEGSSTPIVHTDPAGDAWQDRRLTDGSVHRVLKNHPDRWDLMRLLAPAAAATHWWRLEHYWLFDYRMR